MVKSRRKRRKGFKRPTAGRSNVFRGRRATLIRITPTCGFGKFFFRFFCRFLLDICGFSRFFPYNRRRRFGFRRNFGKNVSRVIIAIIINLGVVFLLFLFGISSLFYLKRRLAVLDKDNGPRGDAPPSRDRAVKEEK